jgi:cytochrome c-type biogenesis protein CcmF
VPTPSVRTGLTNDIYLTLGDPAPQNPDDPARISVSIKPMMLWLWVGGLMMAVGTVLSAFPGRRRRQPTDAVSAPVPDVREPELEASVPGG